MSRDVDDEMIRFLGAENHRIIAEDFDLEMPIETRMALFDIAERMYPRGPEEF